MAKKFSPAETNDSDNIAPTSFERNQDKHNFSHINSHSTKDLTQSLGAPSYIKSLVDQPPPSVTQRYFTKYFFGEIIANYYH